MRFVMRPGYVEIAGDGAEFDELIETIRAAQAEGVAGGSILGADGVGELMIVVEEVAVDA